MIDDWIRRKIGLPTGARLTREAVEDYQVRALRRTISHVKENSAFYARTLADIDPVRDISSTRDLASLPLMGEADLIRFGTELVCVPASVVSRIVTLPTSGTTGEPKRVYFTEADQELMIDYNANGLLVMTGPGDVWLILMPAERPGSVGDLIKRGLERIGCEVIAYGILPYDGSEDGQALALMAERGVTNMLATASAAERLAGGRRIGSGVTVHADETVIPGSARRARDPESVTAQIRNSMKSILLSAEYVSDGARETIERAWDCEVFEHYGMTEMGLGGAMACEAHIGYHPREADLIFEIIDPDTGEVLPDGAYGEVVFTTLTREAMPFIRYRTGDRSRFLPGPCPCGSILKRLDKVSNRRAVKGY
jgi:phenylacetate-coenzyme A ligase PaaK-like adenylate-forming protein